MRCLTLASILHTLLFATSVRSSITYEVDDTRTLVTAKGKMGVDGKLTPMSHEEINAAVELEAAAKGIAREDGTDSIVVTRVTTDVSTDVSTDTDGEAPALSKRLLPIGAVLVGLALATATALVLTTTVFLVAITVSDYNNFSLKRQVFAKNVVDDAWDYVVQNETWRKTISGVMCYNLAYTARNESLIFGKCSKKLVVVPFHTNYDCFYFGGPNYIRTEGDGGWINLAVAYNTTKCRFIEGWSDVECWA